MAAPTFTPGQVAAIYQSNYGDGAARRVTVERETKVYWVAGGRKFRKTDGQEPQARSNVWGSSARLLPLDDYRVVRAEAAARKSYAFSAVNTAHEGLTKDRENPAAINALKAALDAYAKVITELGEN